MAKTNPEILKYKANKSSYLLCMLSLVFNCIAFVAVYENINILTDFRIGIDILINIVAMMIIFLASEKVKAYIKLWAHILIGIAAFQVLRIFFVPLYFLQQDQLSGGQFAVQVLLLIASALALVGASIVCYAKIDLLSKQNKNT